MFHVYAIASQETEAPAFIFEYSILCELRAKRRSIRANRVHKHTQAFINMDPTFSTWFPARRKSCAFGKCSSFAAAVAWHRVALSTEITEPSERPNTIYSKLLFILSMQMFFFSLYQLRIFISLEWIKLSRYLSSFQMASRIELNFSH